MSLCLKGRIWKNGNCWKGRLEQLDLVVKGADKSEVLKELSNEIDEISDEMDYELSAQEDSEDLIFETDAVYEAALLILKRRILKS